MVESDTERTANLEIDPGSVGLVWMDTETAYVVRWRDGPVVQRIESGVPPRRSAVGSVRRGPARPSGGGSVPGHGTEERHDQRLERFVNDVARSLDDLRIVEVAGRGLTHQRLADALRGQVKGGDSEPVVTTRTLSRRPSERQMLARLRRVVDRDLPRRRVGRYRLGVEGPTTATGRPVPAAAGRRTLRPAALPERREIELEVESMLSDEEPASVR